MPSTVPLSPALFVLHHPAVSMSLRPGPGYDERDPAGPVAEALDLGITRGDGIFETITVISGTPQALDAHLARLARSARMLDLPEPDLGAWRATLLAAIDSREIAPEAFVKLLYSRGVEGSDEPTGWVWLQASGDFSRERETGIRVVLLDRGYPSTVQQTSPWLLQGAKTLSYAVNRSAAREAKRRGADDAVFVSSDGYLLEGPTANLVLKVGDRFVTPRTDIGILQGTTQQSVFEIATVNGFSTAYEMLTPADLEAADAAWLVSSVRNAAPITAVDGVTRPIDAQLTSAINAGLAARTA